MKGFRSVIRAVIVVSAVALASAPAAGASCGFLGLRSCPPPPPPPPPASQLNPDGSLAVADNPYDLRAFPQPVPGAPLYPQTNGHLFFGLADHALDEETATADEVGGMVEALGGSFVRLSLYWPGVEPRQGSYMWERYDQQYRTFVKHGLRPLWTLFYTPRDAVAPGARCSGNDSNYCDGEPADTPEAQAELRQFGHDLAVRYPLAAGFEYRNEPDLDAGRQCSTEPSWFVAPDVYARNLTTFAEGIRSGRPAMRVLGGALSNCQLGNRFDKYLDAMLTAGAADGMDAVSWHPYDYSSDRSWFVRDAGDLASTLRAHDQSAMRIVAGEVGVNATEYTQSTRMQWQYNALDTRDTSIALANNYDMFAGFVDIGLSSGFGWLTRKAGWPTKRFGAKQVYCSFRNLLGAGRPMPSYIRGCS